MAVTFVLFFSNIAILNGISQKMQDLSFTIRGPVQPGGEVVIVAIDQKSQDLLGRWPWSRVGTAKLLEKISSYGPRAVGLDIVFSYPEERPDLALATRLLEKTPANSPLRAELERTLEEADADRQLAKAIHDAGNIVPGYFFFMEHGQETKDIKLDNEADYKIIRKSRFPSLRLPPDLKRDFEVYTAVGAKPNIKLITDAAPMTGFFNMVPDGDGTLRKMVNIIKFQDKYFPSISLQTLSHYYGDSQMKALFDEAGVAGFSVGGKIVPSNEHGQTVINYYGPDGSFPVVSVADIMQGTDPARLEAALKDKVVMVGATAIGIYDLRSTPFGIQPGVMAHASFIQNVIDGRVLNRAAWFFAFDAFSIIFLGFLLTFTMRRLKVFGGALLALALALSYLYFQHYMFVNKNTLLDVLYPIIAIFLVYGGIAFYKYAVESREKRYVTKAFEHYLSPDVIGKILKDPGKLKLGGETRELTAFFSDIKGFSSFSEELSPHDLVELLNEYLTEMTDIVLQNSGTLDKYIGDAIVAFWGAPVEFDDHAKRACRVALLCQKRLTELRVKWAAEGRPAVIARIGLNTGPMLVGNMGSHQRFAYTMMGDEVNLAARLEGINKQYGTYICVAESTQRALGDEFETRELDLIRVVGRKAPVRIFELMEFKGALPPESAPWLSAYNAAYESYRQRRWEEARAGFEEAFRLNGHDAASAALIHRCQAFIVNPPDKDWDGVYTHTSK